MKSDIKNMQQGLSGKISLRGYFYIVFVDVIDSALQRNILCYLAFPCHTEKHPVFSVFHKVSYI